MRRATRYDRSIVSVVVIGNGIAGVTAADFIRRGHPDCEIHLVGQEPHCSTTGWESRGWCTAARRCRASTCCPNSGTPSTDVTAWLNTVATRIDLRSGHVLLGTGESLPYDRLILAMGASAAIPRSAGLNRPGTYVLREAADAMRIRALRTAARLRRAVVAGGGLLGLEAAYSLHLLGLRVTVLERGERLLSRYVDPTCSEMVAEHFAKAGIEILRRADSSHVIGRPTFDRSGVEGQPHRGLRRVPRRNGYRPNVGLARRAGVPVRHGVLVDDRMQTPVSGVFAAGDVAEHRGQVLGLWPIATEQAQVAAINALGGRLALAVVTPATILKGVGLELFSIGRGTAEPGDEVIVFGRPGVPSYCRLVLCQGRPAGATVLGHHPADLAVAQKAVRDRIAVGSAAKAALRSGDWSVLGRLPDERATTG